MKTKYIIQANVEIDALEAEKAIKAQLKESGVKMTELSDLTIYIKPLENKCFYVAKNKTTDAEIFGELEVQ